MLNQPGPRVKLRETYRALGAGQASLQRGFRTVAMLLGSMDFATRSRGNPPATLRTQKKILAPLGRVRVPNQAGDKQATKRMHRLYKHSATGQLKDGRPSGWMVPPKLLPLGHMARGVG